MPINLVDNKLVSLALQGYNPFQPECGIFCGGYQGLLYPNPTTLVAPEFDPYQYTEPTASIYTPDTSYTGLGVGNPGIDYKNPGHILGLLDTFGRMSYGIGMLNAIHNGSDGSSDIPPSVNVVIPMMDMSEDGSSTFGLSDIYPSLSEVPTSWLNTFSVDSDDGFIVPDPRPFVDFSIVDSIHSPTLNNIDEEKLNTLFVDKTVFSYIGMPQYLRAVIESLVIDAQSLESEANFEFTIYSPHLFNTFGHQVDPFGPGGWYFPHIGLLDYHVTSDEGSFKHHCKVLSPNESLKVLTGNSNYHDGQDEQNEYRSLTELNSVINIVPIQTIGATYWLDDHSYRDVFDPEHHRVVDDWSPRTFSVASYMISDLVLNISNVPDVDNPEPYYVTIDGFIIIKPIISDITRYFYELVQRLFAIPPPGPIKDTIYGPAQNYRKFAAIAMSMTNKFAWDKTWFDTGLSEDEAFFEDIKEERTEVGGDNHDGYILLDQGNLVVPFNKTFTLTPGCNSIRMRVFGTNRHTVDQGPGTPMIPANLWIPETLPNPGIHFSGWERTHGDPWVVRDELTVPNIDLRFTVTGTKMNSILYNGLV